LPSPSGTLQAHATSSPSASSAPTADNGHAEGSAGSLETPSLAGGKHGEAGWRGFAGAESGDGSEIPRACETMRQVDWEANAEHAARQASKRSPRECAEMKSPVLWGLLRGDERCEVGPCMPLPDISHRFRRHTVGLRDYNAKPSFHSDLSILVNLYDLLHGEGGLGPLELGKFLQQLWTSI